MCFMFYIVLIKCSHTLQPFSNSLKTALGMRVKAGNTGNKREVNREVKRETGSKAGSKKREIAAQRQNQLAVSKKKRTTE